MKYQKLRINKRMTLPIFFIRDESDVIMILGPPGSVKTTTIHSITKMVDDLLHGYVLRLGTTGTAAFFIAGAICHSTLRIPINRQFRPLQVYALRNLQECFAGEILIIAD